MIKTCNHVYVRVQLTTLSCDYIKNKVQIVTMVTGLGSNTLVYLKSLILRLPW